MSGADLDPDLDLVVQTGVVRRTWLRGRLVDDEPAGRLLRRAES